ncbi:hypothetical protein BVC80_949g54 [Macleaya cordata]|uniref:Uncharacterized protein n=1 Tax=Macleaya cordata TaxID=56857 RepID=A0A200QX91_MACCD|nr:hypothetical protein BVC80_949g54 [Macleaya cordata]
MQDSPVMPIWRSPQTSVLLKAENAVLELVGGGHVYWLEKGTVEANPDHILNFIQYEDAASLATDFEE